MKGVFYEKNFLFFVVTLCIVSTFSSVISLQAEGDNTIVHQVRNNIAIDEAAGYHWSGTWGHQEQDCQQGDPGTNVFDAILGNKWGSASVADGDDQWVSVEFFSPQEVGGFKVWQSLQGYSNILKFTIQYQNGSQDWVDLKVADESELNMDTKVYGGSVGEAMLWSSYEYFLETPVTVTAMRFYVAASDIAEPATAAELSEIEIYDEKACDSKVFDGGTGNTGIVPNQLQGIELDPKNTMILCSSQGQPISNILDYDFSTKWASSFELPQWFVVCLDQDTDVAGFSLYQDTNWSDVTAMSVEALVQGKWETVYTLPEDEVLGPVLEIDFDTMWNTDALRFNFTEVGDGCTRDTTITGNTAHSSVDMYELMLFSGKYVEATAVPTEDPNKTPVPTIAPVTNPPESDSETSKGCGSSSAIAQVMLILGAALVIKKKK